MIKVRRGLDLPIAGAPEQIVQDGPKISQVAVIGSDYPGMKPTMAVREGDRVTRGQILFSDKKNQGVVFTAPAAGKVVAINRGERRLFQSLVIDVDGDKAEKFKSYKAAKLSDLDRAEVVDNLVNSGQWVALRTRPYSKVPAIDSSPASIFVTAMDTNPLAADPAVIIAQRSEDFANGLKVLARLTDGPVNVCVAPDSAVSGEQIDGVRDISFQWSSPGWSAWHPYPFCRSGQCRQNSLVDWLSGCDCHWRPVYHWQAGYRPRGCSWRPSGYPATTA